MRSLAREESEESPEESDLKKLASVTGFQPERPLTEIRNQRIGVINQPSGGRGRDRALLWVWAFGRTVGLSNPGKGPGG